MLKKREMINKEYWYDYFKKYKKVWYIFFLYNYFQKNIKQIHTNEILLIKYTNV